MIDILNYGMGNLGSISNMLNKLNIPNRIIDNPEDCIASKKIILPGVGHFSAGMQELNEKKWIPVLNELVQVKQIPVLGICLGMQLMTKYSEEGNVNGLGWIDAEVKKFCFADPKLKVPHMGWNQVNLVNDSNLFKGFETFDEIRFYHVHSYYVELENKCQEISNTYYGNEFTTGFQKGNIYGVQFHPEKSHKFGLQVLKNFGEL